MRVTSAVSAIALAASSAFAKELPKDELRGAGKFLQEDFSSVCNC
jgi:hypothetical protein